MLEMIRRLLSLGPLVLLACGGVAPSQGASPLNRAELERAAVESVMDYRSSTLGHDDAFDVCSIEAALSPPKLAPELLPERFRDILGLRERWPCGIEVPRRIAEGDDYAAVWSIDLDTRSGEVRLRVKRGSAYLSERYHLIRHGPPGPLWRTERVVIMKVLSI